MQIQRKWMSSLCLGVGLVVGVNTFSATPDPCIPERFLKTVMADTAPILEGAPRESEGIVRKQLATKGRYEPELKSVVMDSEETAKMIFGSKPGKTITLDGVKYIEFPNSTALRVMGPDGVEREYLLVRGVRDYENHVKFDGNQAPQNYVSDVLLYERAKNGKFVFRKTILKSAPEKGFLFEDPRISVIYGSTGKAHYFLSGTDYSSHIPGTADKDVMNRFVKLNFDKEGMVREVKVDPKTGKPDFSDMSPAPQLREDGHYSLVDSKNGTITQTENGGIAVRVRLRPDFNDPAIKKLAGDNQWHYGEQVFVFKNWREFRKYDWKHSLEDLFQPANKAGVEGRVRPKVAKELIRDEDLKELYTDSRIMPEKGKGLGPGSIPIRVRRDGDKLYISNGVNAPEEYAGTIPKALRDKYVLKPGEVKFLTPDHEIRYFKEDGFVKRHYTASFKLFNDELTNIEAYYADAIQPVMTRERGVFSGILDLLHTYPMGRTIVGGKGGKKAVVRIFSGISDANTAQYDMDIIKVLAEMSEGSERRVSGQVYVPRAYGVHTGTTQTQ